MRGSCWWMDSGVAGWGVAAWGRPWRRGDPLDRRADVGTPEAHSEPVGSGRQSRDCCHGNQGRRLRFFVFFFNVKSCMSESIES